MFAEIYMKARPQAFLERNIRAGWLKSGWRPLDRQRIKDDASIRDWEQTTPDLSIQPRPTNL